MVQIWSQYLIQIFNKLTKIWKYKYSGQTASVSGHTIVVSTPHGGEVLNLSTIEECGQDSFRSKYGPTLDLFKQCTEPTGNSLASWATINFSNSTSLHGLKETWDMEIWYTVCKTASIHFIVAPKPQKQKFDLSILCQGWQITNTGNIINMPPGTHMRCRHSNKVPVRVWNVCCPRTVANGIFGWWIWARTWFDWGFIWGQKLACLICKHSEKKKIKALRDKSSPVTGLEWPWGFQEVKVPRFHDNGTGWW